MAINSHAANLDRDGQAIGPFCEIRGYKRPEVSILLTHVVM